VDEHVHANIQAEIGGAGSEEVGAGAHAAGNGFEELEAFAFLAVAGIYTGTLGPVQLAFQPDRIPADPDVQEGFRHLRGGGTNGLKSRGHSTGHIGRTGEFFSR